MEPRCHIVEAPLVSGTLLPQIDWQWTSLSKFHVARVSLSRFRVTRDNTGRVPRISEVEVRYVQDDGGPVATTVAAVDPHQVVRGLPVRRVRSHHRRRHYAGMFWSATNRGHVLYESRLELDRLWLADFAPEVIRMAAQLEISPDQGIWFDRGCIAILDPATLIFTSATMVDIVDEAGRAGEIVAHLEYGTTPYANTYGRLARTRTGVQTIRDGIEGDLRDALPYSEILEPLGMTTRYGWSFAAETNWCGAVGR